MTGPEAGAAKTLHSEIVATLSLGLARGADLDEISWDVLHEVLEVDNDNLERAAGILIAVRKFMKP